MTKKQKIDRLISQFDLLLSWRFSPDKIEMDAGEYEGLPKVSYKIRDAKNGEINLNVYGVDKRGIEPCIDVFGRFENAKDWFRDANEHSNKYNFFHLTSEGISFYMNTVIDKLSPLEANEAA